LVNAHLAPLGIDERHCTDLNVDAAGGGS